MQKSSSFWAANLTCTLWEAGNIRVFKGVLGLEGISQHAQPRSTDDGHFRSVLCLGQEPIHCPLVVYMTVRRHHKYLCYVWWFDFILTFYQDKRHLQHVTDCTTMSLCDASKCEVTDNCTFLKYLLPYCLSHKRTICSHVVLNYRLTYR